MKTSVCLYVCTHKRNEPLARLLGVVKVAAAFSAETIDVGVVIVDDNPNGEAKTVVDHFEHDFPLGLHYRHSGKQNISIARNLGIETAMLLADWVAMTDDDMAVPRDWFAQHVALQTATDCGATTGPTGIVFEHGGDWLRDQPFAGVGLLDHEEGAISPDCATGNSMISSSFLIDNPDIRFDPGLGIAGGEDMVFYRAAVAAGLVSRFSQKVAASELAPPERSTYSYQLRRSLWMGNTEWETNLRSGKATKSRLVLRGIKRSALGAIRPFSRLARREAPEFRFAGAVSAQGVGMVLGLFGVVLDHR